MEECYFESSCRLLACTKSNAPSWMFSCLLNCTNGIKMCEASQFELNIEVDDNTDNQSVLFTLFSYQYLQ